MKYIKIWVKVFTLFIFSVLFGTTLHAATITMDVNDTDVQPGEQFRYTISLDYDGSNGLLSNVEVNDTIPAGVTYVGGTVSPAAAQYPADGSTGETIIWRLGSNVAGAVGTGTSGGTTTTSYGAEDQFGTVAYNNSDGNASWWADWIENDDNSASTGNILINNNRLEFNVNSGTNNRDIYREVDLSNADANSATLSVEITANTFTHASNKDRIAIEVSYNNGGSWTLIEEITKSDGTKTITYNLSTGSQTIIRFNQLEYKGGGYIGFDNVEIIWMESTTSSVETFTTEIIPGSLLKSTDGTDTITVMMEINNTAADTSITPSALTVTGFDGALATCGAASPASQNITAGSSIQFDYTCTLSIGSGQGTVKFSADASGDTYSYATGTSVTVIVVPPLTFDVLADDPAPATAENSAWISSYKPLTSDECFAISDEDNTIYHLDLGNATATALTSTTGVSDIEALKFNLDYSVLYGINEDDSGDYAELGTIDQVTGVFTVVDQEIGTISGTYEGGTISYRVHDADGMAFDPTNGDLYAAVRRSAGNDMLIKLDPDTGAHIEDAFGSGEDFLEISSGIANIDDIDGMSFYPDGTLYAIQNNGGSNDYLTIIDKTDGSTTNVGRVEDENGDPINDLESLSFMPDGTLYAMSGNAGPNGLLYSIDRTNAKMLSKGSIADGGDYEGLSCKEADSNFNEVIIEEQEAIISTLPVTISYVYPVDSGGQLEIDFSTATETSNVGFNIYAIKGRKWIKLNEEVIPGAFDSLVPVDYHATVNTPEEMEVKKIGIAGVDVNGVEDRHGPFKIGRESGSKTVIVPIKWEKVRKTYQKDKKARKAKRKAKRVSKKVLRKTLKDQIVNLDVTQNALYRITHEDLMAVDIDLRGFKANKIAVSLRGEGVARHIEELNQRGKWTEDSAIEFMGQAPQGSDALYLEKNRYRLSFNKKLVVESESIEPSSAKELVFEENNKYSWGIPGSDPFYDKMFYTRGAG